MNEEREDAELTQTPFRQAIATSEEVPEVSGEYAHHGDGSEKVEVW